MAAPVNLICTRTRYRYRQMASAKHPARFVHGKPEPQAIVVEVWVNRPIEETSPEKGQQSMISGVPLSSMGAGCHTT